MSKNMCNENHPKLDKSIFIIAEAGVNHNGDCDMAFQLVDVAVAAGVDAVKFQTFKAESIVTKLSDKANYQSLTTDRKESQLEMLKRLELHFEVYQILQQYCEEKKILFMSTAFDFESLEFLVNDLALSNLKISSGDITNGPLLLAYAQSGRDLILSTGMATICEIEEALSVLAFGLLSGKKKNLSPSKVGFMEALQSPEGQKVLKEKVTLLHCTTEYPAPIQEINLNAMLTLRHVFGLPVGYSDHTEGTVIPIAAAAMGAMVIEKHFTLDKTLAGPDHRASLEPHELRSMVNGIRTVEQAMGNGVKSPSQSELQNRKIARKSLVASRKIEIGEKLTVENMTMKRPGTGVSPMAFWELEGQITEKAIEKEGNVL